MSPGIFAILVILIIAVLAIVLVAWFYSRPSKSTPAEMEAKTQPIVQSLYSAILRKRSLIIRQNDGRYKVVNQGYSERVVDLRGEVDGWQSLPKQPVTESLASAVEIAQKWVHTDG